MFAAFNIEDYSHRRYSSSLKPVNINSMWILINIYVEISQAVWLMWKVVTVNAWERFRQTAVRLCSCPQSNSVESHKSCKRESKSISRSSPPAGVPLPPLWIRWKMFPGSRKCFSSTLLLTRYTNLVERSVKELILQNWLETFPRCLWWKGWLTSHKKTTFSTIVLITKTVFGFLHTTFGLIYSLRHAGPYFWELVHWPVSALYRRLPDVLMLLPRAMMKSH